MCEHHRALLIVCSIAGMLATWLDPCDVKECAYGSECYLNEQNTSQCYIHTSLGQLPVDDDGVIRELTVIHCATNRRQHAGAVRGEPVPVRAVSSKWTVRASGQHDPLSTHWRREGRDSVSGQSHDDHRSAGGHRPLPAVAGVVGVRAAVPAVVRVTEEKVPHPPHMPRRVCLPRRLHARDELAAGAMRAQAGVRRHVRLRARSVCVELCVITHSRSMK